MFSKTTEYALRATLYIARKGTEEKKLSIDEIAIAIGSPRSFTAKILQLLSKNNQIISSVRGPGGGFYLTPKAKLLSVYNILEVMGEEDVFNKCVMGLKKCTEEKPCPLHDQYKSIKNDLMQLFQQNTIQHLIDDINKRKLFICDKAKS
jgi:Rrf2 family transcriptional regulator, iron-sulfur cluster assembly transcription factor